jgi:hypothetical protein
MKPVSAPIVCICLFVAGCLCFLVGLNSPWLSDGAEDGGGSPAGGRIPGLEPRRAPVPEAAKGEDTVEEETEAEDEDPAAPRRKRKTEESSPGPDGSPAPGTR